MILRDLAPTILDHVGIDQDPVEMDGRSFASIAEGRSPEPRALHWHFPAYLEGGGAAGLWRTTPVSSIRDGRWKLMEFFEDGRLELYDLEQDQGEETDLSAQHVDVVQRLHSDLRAWRSTVGAGMPTPIESPTEPSPPNPPSGGDA